MKVHEFSLLQEDIDKILNWVDCNINYLQFNVILVTRKPSHHFSMSTALQTTTIEMVFTYSMSIAVQRSFMINTQKYNIIMITIMFKST